jgi:hypothetical protein
MATPPSLVGGGPASPVGTLESAVDPESADEDESGDEPESAEGEPESGEELESDTGPEESPAMEESPATEESDGSIDPRSSVVPESSEPGPALLLNPHPTDARPTPRKIVHFLCATQLPGSRHENWSDATAHQLRPIV